MHNDIYQANIDRALQVLRDLGIKNFTRMQFRGFMNFSPAVTTAVLYRLVKQGVVEVEKDRQCYYRPTKPGSGRSTVAARTTVTFVINTLYAE